MNALGQGQGPFVRLADVAADRPKIGEKIAVRRETVNTAPAGKFSLLAKNEREKERSEKIPMVNIALI